MDADFVEDLKDPQFVDAFIKDWNESRLDMFALSLIGDEVCPSLFGAVSVKSINKTFKA